MMNSIKETYKDFISFLKNPTDEQDLVQTRSQKFKRLFSLLVMDIAVMAILINIISLINKFFLINSESNKVIALFGQFPAWILIILLVVFAPLIEELIFRLYLRFKYNFLIQTIVLAASITGEENKNVTNNYLKTFWHNKFKFVFYFSALLFAFIHLSNFEYSNNILLFSPLLVAPQFFIGLFAGYLRVRYNLVMGYLLHALHNAVFVIIPLIAVSNSVQKVNIKTKEYSLRIEESYKRKEETTSIFSDNVLIFKNEEMQNIIAHLSDKDQILIKGDKEILNKVINIDFKFFAGNLQHNKKIVLDQVSKAYHFKTTKIVKKEIIWNIILADSVLLKESQSVSGKNPGVINTSLKDIVFKNTALNNIAVALSEEFNVSVINNTNFAGNYNITIPKKSFAKLNEWLTQKYGLHLQKAKKEVEYINITAE